MVKNDKHVVRVAKKDQLPPGENHDSTFILHKDGTTQRWPNAQRNSGAAHLLIRLKIILKIEILSS